jgi:hypothetical protein
MLGPFGLSKTVLTQTSILSKLQTGVVYDYSLWMFLGVLAMIFSVQFCNVAFLIDPSLVVVFLLTLVFSIT